MLLIASESRSAAEEPTSRPPIGLHREFACHATPDGMLAVRSEDGTLAAERLASGHYEWVVAAADLQSLVQRIDLLLASMPAIEMTRRALATHDIDAARTGITTLASSAPDLRTLLIDSYQRAPRNDKVQTALGIVCLAAGRHEEGMFHLLRATPGQVEWFAVCRRYYLFRTSPAACRQLVVTACAAELLGRTHEVEMLHKTLRIGVRLMRLAEVCVTLSGDLLWTRPDVLVHVRGVLEIGTPAAMVGALERLEIRRVLAFAASAAHCDELRSVAVAASAKGAAWSVVPAERDPRTTPPEVDAWFATARASAADYNLLRIGAGVSAHRVLSASRRTLQSIDFVCAVADARPSSTDLSDDTTVPGFLSLLGFVEIAATDDGDVPRQVLYARAEHV